MKKVLIRHLLLIKFKQSAKFSELEEIMVLFESLTNKIEGILSVECGVNDNPDNKNKVYTHLVMITFENDEYRRNYLMHPEHVELKKIFKPLVEELIVFDYKVLLLQNELDKKGTIY
ncbi:MAG: Dabb family protein [Ignavibacteriae bacterium]|nr:Dabb family protein [Ignavibacteriota bacterium]